MFWLFLWITNISYDAVSYLSMFFHGPTCSEKHKGLESPRLQTQQLHSDSHPYASQAPSIDQKETDMIISLG